MKIAILGEGTRGDIWPLIALGAHMTRRGHEVAVVGDEEFRAVVNMPSADGGASAVNQPEHLRTVGAVDHERLLTRCSAAVHHGGAGTLAASLRAGLPTMVCSVWADQPFWGKRLETLGAGAHVPFKRLDAHQLEAGLLTLRSDLVREWAAALGTAIRAEGDGTELAAQLLDDWLCTAKPRLTR